MAEQDIIERVAGAAVDTGTERMIARKDGAIGWLIFNNPARRNAVSVDMWAAIPKALAAFEADPAIRVIVLAGAGDKAFVSGADISQFENMRANPEDNEEYKAVSGGGQAAISRLTKPSIAMIKGFCIGGGLAVALSCDLRIAAEGSRFAIPAAKLGLGYNYAGLATLASIVGPAYAREIMFTARQFTGDEALRMGLINRLVPLADLEKTIRDYAGMIGANAPLTVKAAKMAVNEFVKDASRRDIAKVEAAVDACFASADYAEGRKAFMEKRTPNFQGK
jgi:enoyl-CoA hydratase/carnithine racemase